MSPLESPTPQAPRRRAWSRIAALLLTIGATGAIVLGTTAATTAKADRDGREGREGREGRDDHSRSRRGALTMPAAYVGECGSCHVAYLPGHLPAASWQRLMSGLDAHFGSDVSLDAAANAGITDWLVAHASRRSGATSPPDDRITRSAWFAHEHDEVPAATWSRPAVKSASNCEACHRNANQGHYDEDDVRIPR